MGVQTFETVLVCTLPPSTMFKAVVINSTQLLTKALPQVYDSIEVLEGDGGAGTIRVAHFAKGLPFKYMKEIIESIDEEKLTYSTTVLEGDVQGVEKIRNDFQFEASPNGGTIIKKQSHYYTIGDYQVDEEEMNSGKEKSAGLFKILEAYISANPDICN